MADDEVTFDTQREAMLSAMADTRITGGTIFVCRGELIGCIQNEHSCDNCYVIHPFDKRTVDEHLAAFNRRDA